MFTLPQPSHEELLRGVNKLMDFEYCVPEKALPYESCLMMLLQASHDSLSCHVPHLGCRLIIGLIMNVSKSEHFFMRRPVHKKRAFFCPSVRICMGAKRV